MVAMNDRFAGHLPMYAAGFAMTSIRVTGAGAAALAGSAASSAAMKSRRNEHLLRPFGLAVRCQPYGVQ